MKSNLMVSVSSICLLMVTVLTATVYGLGPYNSTGATVIDSGTSLEWQQSDDGQPRTWQQALGYCENLPLAGYSDWRLPNIQELYSIADVNHYSPSIRIDYFSCQVSTYWSSTTCTPYSYSAWDVPFGSGSGGGSFKTNSHYVRCVRTKFWGHHT
jgi:hypothetical protein